MADEELKRKIEEFIKQMQAKKERKVYRDLEEMYLDFKGEKDANWQVGQMCLPYLEEFRNKEYEYYITCFIKDFRVIKVISRTDYNDCKVHAIYPDEYPDIDYDGVVTAHNHPSGLQPFPSYPNDLNTTKCLKNHLHSKGKILYDNFILTNNYSYSFREHGIVLGFKPITRRKLD